MIDKPDFPETAHRPIPRSPRLMEVIADQLRAQILEGQIPPGTVLRQEQVAQQLGVSRTPLREALLMLEQDGLLTFSPSGVATVVLIDAQDAREIMDIREMVDGMVASILAVKGIPPAARQQLNQLVDEMMAANLAADKHRYLVANARFHLTLLEATEHKRLRAFVPLVRMSAQAVYVHLQAQTERLVQSAGEHAAILTAIDGGDSELAERVARSHVRHAANHWLPPRQGRTEPAQGM